MERSGGISAVMRFRLPCLASITPGIGCTSTRGSISRGFFGPEQGLGIIFKAEGPPLVDRRGTRVGGVQTVFVVACCVNEALIGFNG